MFGIRLDEVNNYLLCSVKHVRRCPGNGPGLHAPRGPCAAPLAFVLVPHPSAIEAERALQFGRTHTTREKGQTAGARLKHGVKAFLFVFIGYSPKVPGDRILIG